MNEAQPPYWDQLDADARFVARVIAETLDRPVRELGVETARKLLATPPPRRPLTHLDRVEHLTLPARSGELRARLYLPDGPPESGRQRPALVYLHGGGFALGTLDGVDEVCRAIAARSGWAVFSLEYRLAPENPYPAALDDCFDAYAWLCGAAPGFGIDAHMIAVGGDSAGGNLAAALCLMLRDLGLARPVSQVLVYPAVDGAFATPSWTEFADAPLLTSADARWFWEQYIGPGGAVDHFAAPMRAASLRDLPPALVLTAAVDPLRDDAEAYAERLRRDGVEVTATRYDGVFHGFFTEVGLFARTDEALTQVARHLRGIAGA
ncbi:alpha/beta hydrolase [Streptomyces boluensis]|uniref:Alpha/beta hydrolase fold domain-containing protein n=1 Tax=Streptomyces boluensis TaxID=1775135 RepID=A0A964XIH1_9ACTN|nr:alpha/beta hydrolase [Streptomyces boluensis]NBE50199.1 alpha/beta hydrolase fold domain-containing protein [Streptomyces boluensis]